MHVRKHYKKKSLIVVQMYLELISDWVLKCRVSHSRINQTLPDNTQGILQILAVLSCDHDDPVHPQIAFHGRKLGIELAYGAASSVHQRPISRLGDWWENYTVQVFVCGRVISNLRS